MTPPRRLIASRDGYTDDIQCVTYAGPDPDHQGSVFVLQSRAKSSESNAAGGNSGNAKP